MRCYEHRIGRVNVTNSKFLVDYTQVLWSKSDDVEYEPIGGLDYPFRITLPANVAGFSTALAYDWLKAHSGTNGSHGFGESDWPQMLARVQYVAEGALGFGRTDKIKDSHIRVLAT